MGAGASRNSWKVLALPTFSMISHRQIMENVGFTNISNNFHDFPNYGSGSWGFSKIMETVGFTNIFREPIMENVGFTNISNNLHDCPNHGSGSWGFSKIMEIVGFIMENVHDCPNYGSGSWVKSWNWLGLPTFSLSQSSTLTHEVSRNSWKLLELLV